MANEVLTKVGTQIAFYDSGNYSPADDGTNYEIGTPTAVALHLSGVANNAGQQSAKADLGATRAPEYEVLAAVDYTGETPTGGLVRVYWLPSTSTTAANGNVAGNSGSNATAPDGAVPGGLTLEEFAAMGQYIGALKVTDDAAVQNGLVSASFRPSSRYGQVLVINGGGDAFEADNVECGVFFNPIVPEIQ